MLIGLGVLFQLKCWGLALVDEVWVEDVELVALHDLGWWVVVIIVSLVVLVPLVAGMHAVEVLGLARSVLVMPPIHLQTHMHGCEHLPALGLDIMGVSHAAGYSRYIHELYSTFTSKAVVLA